MAAPTDKITIDAIAGDDVVTKAESTQLITLRGTLWKDLGFGYEVQVIVGGTAYPAVVSESKNPNKEDWSLVLTGDKLTKLLAGDQLVVVVREAITGLILASESRAYHVDILPPAAGTLSFSGLTDTGSQNIIPVTQDNTFDLSLSGNDAGTVTYEASTNGGATWTSLASPNLADLADGRYEFRAVVTDAAGNTSYSNVQSVVVDNTSPEASTLGFANLSDTGLGAADGLTSDTTFDLFLTGNDASNTVVYQHNIGTGGWTNLMSPNLTNLADGTYQFRAVITDAAGNVSYSDEKSVAVDTTKPATLGVALTEDTGAADGITSNSELTLTGTEDGARLEYFFDGKWTTTPPTAADLVQGSNTVQVRQTDKVGNVSEVSSITFTLATSAADGLAADGSQVYLTKAGDASVTTFTKVSQSPWKTPDVIKVGSGLPASNKIAFDGPDFQGAADGRSTDAIKMGGLVRTTQPTGTQEDFFKMASGDQTTPGANLVEGDQVSFVYVRNGDDTYSIYVDANGDGNLDDGDLGFVVEAAIVNNVGIQPVGTDYFVDKFAPVVPSVALKEDSGAADRIISNPELVFTGIEKHAKIEYSVDGGTTWTGSFTAVEGENSVQVRQMDKAGNASQASEVFTFTLDTTAPAAGTLSFPSLDGSAAGTKDNTFDLSLTGQEDGASVTYEVKDAEGNWNATTAQQKDLEDGSYEFRAVVTDAAGNTSYSNVKSVVVDTTAPAAGMLSLSGLSDTGPNATGGLTSDNTFDLTLTNNEANSTVAFEVSKDGGASWQVTSSAQNGLTDGNYLFRAVVTDAAGSSSYSNAKSIVVDTSLPSVAVAIAALGANGTSTVTLTFGEAITGLTTDDLHVTGGSVANLTADPSGKIFTGTFTPAANFDGTASITVNAGSYTDVAGNPGAAGGATLAVDVKAPTVDMLMKSFLGAHAVTFNFSDQVGGASFTADDLVVRGATVKALVSDSSTSQTALMHTALGSGGKISVAVKDGSYTDDSENVGVGLSKTFDVTTLKATAGADWLVGTGGRNVLKGGAGDDIVRGRGGNDVITGGSGKDLLDLSDGKKGIKIDFSAANVKYAALDGRAAGLGVDKYRDMEGVIGTNYSDKITGSSSGDILAGLGGNDILRGGRGNDVFVFEAKGGRDRIMDFGDKARNQDGLDLRYFDFNVTTDSFAAWKASHVKQMGANVLVNIDATTSVKLIDVKAKAIGFDDFLF